MGREQAHDGEGCDRFAGAGFADQAKDFSGSDGKIEIANGGQGAGGGSRAGLCGCEIYVQVADFEKRTHGAMLAAKRVITGYGRLITVVLGMNLPNLPEHLLCLNL